MENYTQSINININVEINNKKIVKNELIKKISKSKKNNTSMLYCSQPDDPIDVGNDVFLR